MSYARQLIELQRTNHAQRTTKRESISGTILNTANPTAFIGCRQSDGFVLLLKTIGGDPLEVLLDKTSGPVFLSEVPGKKFPLTRWAEALPDMWDRGITGHKSMWAFATTAGSIAKRIARGGTAQTRAEREKSDPGLTLALVEKRIASDRDNMKSLPCRERVKHFDARIAAGDGPLDAYKAAFKHVYGRDYREPAPRLGAVVQNALSDRAAQELAELMGDA